MGRRLGFIGLFALLIVAALVLLPGSRQRVRGWIPTRLGGTRGLDRDLMPIHPTFCRDIAPVVFENCAGCHHPQGVGPFSLLTLADLRKHSKETADLTSRRLMPPWMPDESCGPFEGQRRLSAGQIELFQRWTRDGMPEGNQSDLPAAPVYRTDWELGEPDLIVKLPAPFVVPADGKDFYQNFVLPVGLDAPRTVRAVELRSGNPRVVHHAFLLLDTTGAAKIRAQRAGGLGYPGMSAGDGVSGLEGQFLMWQPGTSFCVKSDPWRLPAGADIVLQMHLRPTGKPESLQPQVGLYFTDKPPTTLLFTVMLRSVAIDIPPGSRDYTITNSYTLPVDAQVIAATEHTHYLGRDLQGFATLPDGTRRMLLHIPNWDFLWQGSYRFVEPVTLPKGTVLQMHFTYDNSNQNPNNPTSPPRRVVYGLNSDDEMGEFSSALRVANETDYRTLAEDYSRRIGLPDAIAQTRSQLAVNPQDADLHAKLAVSLMKAGQRDDGMAEVQTALRLRSDCAKAHRCMANILFAQNRVNSAIEEFRKAIAADPSDFNSQADLGLALATAGNLSEGVEQLQLSLRQNPYDALTHTNLARVYLIQNDVKAARIQLQRALQLDPKLPLALETMRHVESAVSP